MRGALQLLPRSAPGATGRMRSAGAASPAAARATRAAALHHVPWARAARAAAVVPSAAAERVVAPAPAREADSGGAPAVGSLHDASAVGLNQDVREGTYEARLVMRQARKRDDDQPSLASGLPPPDLALVYDVCVIGAGPSGLALACEIGKRGVSVVVVGLDLPITNNYGVWTDEFEDLGLLHTLEKTWPDAVCYFGEGEEVRVGRPYGRVGRRKLREHLLFECSRAGVTFMDAEVDGVKVVEDGKMTKVSTSGGPDLSARMTTVAAGAAAARLLSYERDAPLVAAQTAYGIEAEVEGFDGSYLPDVMTFMDFRRHHTGLWSHTATPGSGLAPGMHPNAGDGLWGTTGEAPSFLYAMPLGGKRVFLEETCLVAKPALPFAVLKRRLERRLQAAGVKVTSVHEEEWSYIPVGGPLPRGSQPMTAFGAAANMVHPATGYSVARSFREAPGVADEMVASLRGGLSVPDASARVWERLWPQEKRTQASFHVFGMELLSGLDLNSTNSFFRTFFRLPGPYWRGFLASTLSTKDLVLFALVTFVMADFNIKAKLVQHLLTDPAGSYLVDSYKALYLPEAEEAKQTEQA
ncbi:hypothetical protein FOA52_003968 [Chlamydomonas sp. UWO 241]|nr:hypothetical protein FOA52_003968 [Chlamydomonas sp. UWO 241]